MFFSFLSSMVANARVRRTFVYSVVGLIVTSIAFCGSVLLAPSAFAATKRANNEYTYAGQLTSSTGATTNIVINFTVDSQGSISGTMTFTPDNSRSGPIAGTFTSNSTFTFDVVPTNVYYAYYSQFQGTVNSDGTMSGTYTTTGYNENNDPTNPNDTGQWTASAS